jgi:aminoglycoside N3'-acetyltransferase
MRGQISATHIRSQLDQVIDPSDEIVVIFGGVWMFGSKLGVVPNEVPSYLTRVILDHLGPSRTVLFPTFTYGYAKTRKYDVVLTPSETGILTEVATQSGLFQRTNSPLNSYVVCGPRSDEVLGIRDETLWGSSSVMGWCERSNARICMLGEPWENACTQFHMAQELLRVPYRYFKRFPGELHREGNYVETVAPIMYVRPLNFEVNESFVAVAPRMRELGCIRSADSTSLPLESALSSDITSTCSQMLQTDPFVFVVNRDEVATWVKAGGTEAEVSQLPGDERV